MKAIYINENHIMEKLCDLSMTTRLNSFKAECESGSLELKTQPFSTTACWEMDL